MKLKFWGTRGSLPRATLQDDMLAVLTRLGQAHPDMKLSEVAAGLKTLTSPDHGPLTWGGNTTCLEVSHGKTSVYVDAGSGLRDAGNKALASGRTEFTLFLTHMHWDHLLGLPFFIPIFRKGTSIRIVHVHPETPEHVKILFNGVNFPVRWEQLGATITFERIEPYKPSLVGELVVTPFRLDHPGGAWGYHFAAGGKRLSIGCDSEYKRLTPAELGPDLPYYQDVDALVFDAQYEMRDMASKFDFGHSAATIGVDLALRERVRTLFFTHHDPWAPDEKLRKAFADTKAYVQKHLKDYADIWSGIQPAGPRIASAYDGLEVEIV